MSALITNYVHRSMPDPAGRCRACGEQVTSSVASQGRIVDISGYGDCQSLTLLERLEIDLEHAQDRVREIERRIKHAKAVVSQ